MVNLDSDDLLSALRERASECFLSAENLSDRIRGYNTFTVVADFIEHTYIPELVPDDQRKESDHD